MAERIHKLQVSQNAIGDHQFRNCRARIHPGIPRLT
jgi:hypothetical protein